MQRVCEREGTCYIGEKEIKCGYEARRGSQSGNHVKCFHLCLKSKRKLSKDYNSDKKNTILRNKLTKEAEDLYAESNKTLLKEINKIQVNGKTSMFMNWKA